MIKSRVTERSQTTLPNGVRKALGLKPGEDQIEWEIRGNQVIARRAIPDEDPALDAFLDLLERDAAEYPQRLRAMPQSLLERLVSVTQEIKIDLDQSIEGEVAL